MASIDKKDIILAYTQGYFPMAHPEEDNEIYWHRPEQRGIIPLDKFHIPKTLRRTYSKGLFELHQNRDFRSVIEACANRTETWISDEILDMYCSLYEDGLAHSFEAWQDGKLVGGLYGISIGKAFFGESMFHTVTDASKVSLVYLVETLHQNDYQLLDIQYLNDHTRRFGGIEIPDRQYQKMLIKALTSS